MNVKSGHILNGPAITIHAGEGREDRLFNGSYIELRNSRMAARPDPAKPSEPSQDDYLPDFLR